MRSLAFLSCVSYPGFVNPVLQRMYDSGTVCDDNGRAHEFHSGVTREQASSLERICRVERPTASIEVGLAYGASALAILEGKNHDEGRHYAIDPFQSSQWGLIGVRNVGRAGFEDRFVLVEEPSDVALPRLVGKGVRVDFAFIDGDHSLEAALLDWHYIDQLLVEGGIVVFHDYPTVGVYFVVTIALDSGRYQRITRWEARRPWRRRVARAAATFVQSRGNLVLTMAAAGANTQMPILRKLRLAN